MKSTGVVRHIDKLGRIVIPKEIRRNLKIRDEDNLEIFIENDNIILKKYSLFNGFEAIIEGICDVINNLTNKNIFITDMEKVLSSNEKVYNYNNVTLNSNYINLIERREKLLSETLSDLSITTKNEKDKYYLFEPIIINGELIGSIIMFSYEEKIDSNDKLLMQFILKYLEKNIED